MAKMEGMKRHEEQIQKAEKDRIMQQVQAQQASTYHPPSVQRFPNTSSTPKVITVQGSKFQVTSGGCKLLRLSGVSGVSGDLERA